MKKLIVSYNTPSRSLNEFKKALKTIKKSPKSSAHYEIAFDNKKDFTKFLNNIDLLITIKSLRPKSVYELAKIVGKDQSNVNKLIQFFESHGVVSIKKTKENNREVKRPVVDYGKIEFDLSA
jgi:predicted transcriptional regulator